ncbi:MAG: hypothetical protein ABFS28_07045 [Bacteroidota bacterium]
MKVLNITVSMITTNQGYGSGIRIADWPGHIIAECSLPGEQYISGALNLKQLSERHDQLFSLVQFNYLPELHQVLVTFLRQ